MSFWYILCISIFLICLITRTDPINKSKISKYVYILVIIALCIIAGIRTEIGDTDIYLRYIVNTPVSFGALLEIISSKVEWGFYILLFILKKIFFENGQLVLAFFSTFTITAFLIKFKKLTKMYDLAIYLFICSATFITIMNGMRQYFVSSIIFLCISLLANKKYIKMILICYCLSFIHNSVLIIIPIMFLLNKEPWTKTTYIIIFSSIILYITYPLYNGIIVNYISDGQYTGYAKEILNQQHGGNFIRVIVAYVPLLLSLMSYKKLKNKGSYNLIFNFSVFNAAFYLLAVRHYIFARFCFYFSPFSLILLCLSIENIENKNTRFVLYVLCVILYFIYYYYQVSVVWNTPYTTIFDNPGGY